MNKPASSMNGACIYTATKRHSAKPATADADSTVMSLPIKALLRDIMRLYAAMAQADPDLIHDQEASEAFQVCGNHDSVTFDALDSLIA